MINELVDWLIGLEDCAAKAYTKAATLFPDDPAFHALLVNLGKDEESHCKALRRARAFIGQAKDFPVVVTLDEESKWDIESPFIELRSKLDYGKITEKELINLMLVIEYSELNRLFLSILNSVKELSGGEVCLFMDIEAHKARIEGYIETRPGFEGYIERVKGLPGSSAEMKLLIVDDTESNLAMLRAIFEGKFSVDTARNGAEAFEKLSSGHYSAVISDVEMPVMDGVEFYSKAREIIPGISERFMFYSATLNVERISFFNENRIKYLVKPASISNIRAAVMDIAV